MYFHNHFKYFLLSCNINVLRSNLLIKFNHFKHLLKQTYLMHRWEHWVSMDLGVMIIIRWLYSHQSKISLTQWNHFYFSFFFPLFSPSKLFLSFLSFSLVLSFKVIQSFLSFSLVLSFKVIQSFLSFSLVLSFKVIHSFLSFSRVLSFKVILSFLSFFPLFSPSKLFSFFFLFNFTHLKTTFRE